MGLLLIPKCYAVVVWTACMVGLCYYYRNCTMPELCKSYTIAYFGPEGLLAMQTVFMPTTQASCTKTAHCCVYCRASAVLLCIAAWQAAVWEGIRCGCLLLLLLTMSSVM